MINQEIAQIFSEMAVLLEMDDIPFKPEAYRKAALYLDSLDIDLKDLYEEKGIKGLEDIPGIGKNLAEKIVEYIKINSIKAYKKYQKQFPIDLKSLMKIEGLGPKRIKELYEKLGVKTISDLEKTLAKHQISQLPGFGEKSEANILSGLQFLKVNQQRFSREQITPKVDEIIRQLKKLKEVKQISVAGSFRRKKPTVGDVDLLVTSSSPQPIMDRFIKLPGVYKVWGVGPTKASIAMKEGFDVDLRIVPESSYGAALLYFTGSKDHNIYLRKIAQEKGLKLNEYGLFRGNKMVAGKTEEEVYQALGKQWLPPEKRQ